MNTRKSFRQIAAERAGFSTVEEHTAAHRATIAAQRAEVEAARAAERAARPAAADIYIGYEDGECYPEISPIAAIDLASAIMCLGPHRVSTASVFMRRPDGRVWCLARTV